MYNWAGSGSYTKSPFEVIAHSCNLSVDGDIEEDEEDEGDDSMDEEVWVDQVDLDVEGVQAQGGRGDAGDRALQQT